MDDDLQLTLQWIHRTGEKRSGSRLLTNLDLRQRAALAVCTADEFGEIEVPVFVVKTVDALTPRSRDYRYFLNVAPTHKGMQPA